MSQKEIEDNKSNADDTNTNIIFEKKKKKKRYFKVIFESPSGNNEIILGGRYSGSKPKQSASKAFTSILDVYNLFGIKNVGDVKFGMVETTRLGRNKMKKTFWYEGEKKPVVDFIMPKLKKIGKETFLNDKGREIKKVVYEKFDPTQHAKYNFVCVPELKLGEDYNAVKRRKYSFKNYVKKLKDIYVPRTMYDFKQKSDDYIEMSGIKEHCESQKK